MRAGKRAAVQTGSRVTNESAERVRITDELHHASRSHACNLQPTPSTSSTQPVSIRFGRSQPSYDIVRAPNHAQVEVLSAAYAYRVGEAFQLRTVDALRWRVAVLDQKYADRGEPIGLIGYYHHQEIHRARAKADALRAHLADYHLEGKWYRASDEVFWSAAKAVGPIESFHVRTASYRKGSPRQSPQKTSVLDTSYMDNRPS